MSHTLFVSGASGQLGRLVVESLLAREQRVVAGTRSPEKLADLAERGAIVRHADFSKPESLITALEGVDRALLISTSEVGTRLDLQRAAVDAAARAGVKHLVYTSVVAPDEMNSVLATEHAGTEAAIRDAFASYTLLRNNLYAELVIDGVAPALATGKLVTARGEGAIAWVSRTDCAEAAAAALADGFDGTRVLDITGPAALTGDEMAALFTDRSGQTVEHLSLPLDAFVAGLVEHGVPEPYAQLFGSFDVAAQAGLLGTPSGAVEALTGKAPRSLGDVLEESGVFG